MTAQMNKIIKKKRIIQFALLASVVLLIVSIWPILYYGPKIPDMPELNTFNNELRKQIRDANRKAHKRPGSNNLGTLGAIYHSSQLYEKAADCYKIAINRNGSSWIWSYYLGCLDKEMSKSQEAINNFKKALEKNPRAYNALYYIGEEYQNIGLYDEALSVYAEIPGTDPVTRYRSGNFRRDYYPLNIYAKYQTARIHLNLKQYDKAEETLLDILENYSYGPAYRLLGSLYSAKGNSAASEACMTRSNELFNITNPVDTLTDLLALRSNSESFILKQIDKADYDSYLDWANILINNALNYAPDNKYVISKAIRILFRTQSENRALDLLETHFLNFSDNLSELKEVADILYNNGFFEQSARYYLRAIELAPQDTEIQANLVLSMFRDNNTQAADDLLMKFVKDQPGNAEVIINASYISILMEKWDQADHYLEQLEKISPSNPKGLLLSGLCKLEKGKTKEAETLFRRSFRNKPDILSAEALGDLLTEQKRWREAINHYKLALVPFPNEPSILLKLGILLVSSQDETLRDYDQGIEYLQRLIVHKSCPPDHLIKSVSNLSQTYEHLGNERKASACREFLNNLLQVTSNPRYLIVKLDCELKKP